MASIGASGETAAGGARRPSGEWTGRRFGRRRERDRKDSVSGEEGNVDDDVDGERRGGVETLDV